MKKQILKLSAVLSAMFLFAGVASAQHEAPYRTIEIPHVLWTGTAWETIDLDGVADEGSWSEEDTLTEQWEPDLDGGIVLSETDLSGFIKMCYDDENIYLFAKITDDTACKYALDATPNGTDEAIYKYDNVEVWFDLDTTPATSGSYTQVTDTVDAAQFRWNRGSDTATGDAARNDIILNDFMQTDDETGGWTLEVKIPFLSFMPEGSLIEDLADWVDKTMGFDIGFADSDEEDNQGTVRSGALMWDADVEGSGQEENNAWKDTRVFGGMTLGVVPSATRTAASEGIVLFPNPAEDVLNITNLNNVTSINIVNTLGQVVVVSEVTASTVQVDLSDLTSGLYVVVMNKANGGVITSTIVK